MLDNNLVFVLDHRSCCDDATVTLHLQLELTVMNGAWQEHRTAPADLYLLWETSGENGRDPAALYTVRVDPIR